jgi:hypothetical protein
MRDLVACEEKQTLNPRRRRLSFQRGLFRFRDNRLRALKVVSRRDLALEPRWLVSLWHFSLRRRASAKLGPSPAVKRDARLLKASGRKSLVIFLHDRVIPDEKMMLAEGG